MALLILATMAVQAQGTLQKLKFEEAEQAFGNKKYAEALKLIDELEKEGLVNPKTLHLKIMATSKMKDPSPEKVLQLEQDINKYLTQYDIEGLEDKYKEVYEVNKELGIIIEEAGIQLHNKKDYNKALSFFLKVARLADASTYRSLAILIDYYTYEDYGIGKNTAEAGKYQSRLESELSQKGLYMIFLGNMYHYGVNEVKKDRNKALSWYLMAYPGRMSYAATTIAQLYEDEFNNGEKAIEWYSKHVSPVNIQKDYAIGRIYEKGKAGVPRNMDKAIEWYSKVKYFDNESLNVMRHLGYIYENGIGVSRDLNKARELYGRALRNLTSSTEKQDEDYSDNYSCFLGLMYEYGQGVERDYNKAQRLYDREVKSKTSNATAFLLMGEIFEEGLGVPQNLTRAVEWYTRAAQKGSDRAKYKLDKLKSR